MTTHYRGRDRYAEKYIGCSHTLLIATIILPGTYLHFFLSRTLVNGILLSQSYVISER